MKSLLLLTIIALLSAQAGAQTIYSVPANSKGNQLTLTIANESKTTSAQNVHVTPGRLPQHVSIPQSSRVIKLLPAGKESDATFTFDVSRDARIGGKDTLEFTVTDAMGSTWSKTIVVSYTGPQEYKLEQNFPNPFNPSTTIYYQLPMDSRVTLKIYDLLGREVRTLVDEQQQAGYKEARFNGASLASGAYFCRMTAQGATGKASYSNVKKLLMIK